MTYPLSPNNTAALISAIQSITGLWSGTGAAAALSGTPAQIQAAVSNLLSIVNPPIQTVDFPLTDGISSQGSYAHGLGRNPVELCPSLYCISNDAGSGMVVGQEFYCEGLLAQGSPIKLQFGVSYDNNNLYWTYAGIAASTWGIPWNGTAQVYFTSFSNFKLRFRYR